MTLQLRPKAGEGVHNVAYAPARDIAYLYPNVVQAMENMLYQQKFPVLKTWLQSEGVTEEELAKTVEAYCLFLNLAHKEPEETVEMCLERSGFTGMPAPAQVALMFYLGSIMTGTFFKGIRDITPLGGDTTFEVHQLVKMGERCADYAMKGRFGKWWVRTQMRLWPFKKKYTIQGKM